MKINHDHPPAGTVQFPRLPRVATDVTLVASDPTVQKEHHSTVQQIPPTGQSMFTWTQTRSNVFNQRLHRSAAPKQATPRRCMPVMLKMASQTHTRRKGHRSRAPTGGEVEVDNIFSTNDLPVPRPNYSIPNLSRRQGRPTPHFQPTSPTPTPTHRKPQQSQTGNTPAHRHNNNDNVIDIDPNEHTPTRTPNQMDVPPPPPPAEMQQQPPPPLFALPEAQTFKNMIPAGRPDNPHKKSPTCGPPAPNAAGNTAPFQQNTGNWLTPVIDIRRMFAGMMPG
ncbi:hypothetical protein B0H10DRAFT_1939659 [Mycena sp. CBHHK59/15]|nr:hypothetical protein B0H10DRAFT_1939659 [Mycena sp. CBHHK59/15]